MKSFVLYKTILWKSLKSARKVAFESAISQRAVVSACSQTLCL